MLSGQISQLASSRVNITLDVLTNGAEKKRELPLKLLVMGGFSGSSRLTGRRVLLQQNDALNNTITDYEPRLKFLVKNTLNNKSENLSVDLKFLSMTDFHPQSLVGKIPELQRMMAMRNLISDFRANLMDRKKLFKSLLNLLGDKKKIVQLLAELQQLSPLK